MKRLFFHILRQLSMLTGMVWLLACLWNWWFAASWTRHSTLRLHYMGDSAESRADYLCPASPENRRQCLLGRDNARSPHCGATGVECPAPVPDKRSSRCLRRWRYTRTRRLALGFRRLWECNPACSIDPPAAENLPQDINVVSGYPPISLPQINGAGNARQ